MGHLRGLCRNIFKTRKKYIVNPIFLADINCFNDQSLVTLVTLSKICESHREPCVVDLIFFFSYIFI